MKIRKATLEDIDNIMHMYNSCVSGMIDEGIDQWDSTYPNKQILLKDIKCSTYFVVEINKEIIAGINIDKNQDKTYLSIKWYDKSNSFLVVHRLAGKKLMLFTERLVINNKLNSIRLDTYSGNPKAMEFYSRLGYKNMGSIQLKINKEDYFCFEKIIS
jgi:predicted GNAT family acetyltransferase